MAIELTPNGTRGAKRPSLPRPVVKALVRLNVVFYRLLGKRLRMSGAPMCLLTTVGARSGQPRRSTLCCFPDGDNAWLIVASFGGAATHPSWYVNMARNPDKVSFEVQGRERKVTPESLKGSEREAAFKRIVSQAANYGGYQQKTDREIPVVRLTASE